MNDASPAAAGHDMNGAIIAAVRAAQASGTPLYISAGGSKRRSAGRDCPGEPLDVSGHRGIVDYQPRELVITARAGTPVSEIETALAAEGQQLAFEPPTTGGRSTLGGTLASNLSGPARPWAGAARDAVLGVKLVNGRGELLNFGGQVMKNVAGYDVSRLQAGALGTLGVLSEISMKVTPRPQTSVTLCYDSDAASALATMHRRAAQSAPLDGACWCDRKLYLRLTGADSAVRHTANEWGGDLLDASESPWVGLRELTLPFFHGDAPLWRLSHSATAPFDTSAGATLIDWGGALRWLRRGDPTVLHDAARRAGGHACLFRGGDRASEVRGPLDRVQRRLHRHLKRAFDPAGILNPGRLYSWL